MAHKYCVRKKTHLSEDKEKAMYYAVPVSSGIVQTKQLAYIISDRCSATEADILLVLNSLSSVMKKLLDDGKKVRLEDIGLFSLSVSSEGFETPEECTPKQVHAKRICFKADKTLKETLAKIEFEKVK
jgi:predicted histone-like DNA-binding protein